MPNFKPSEALLEHMLGGDKVSLLEAIVLFGVQNPNAEFARIKKKGFLIKSQPASMTKILRRINEYTVCKPPENLPYKEITLREYWISK
jgi:hypothetical protein